jgi:hypothetical protein
MRALNIRNFSGVLIVIGKNLNFLLLHHEKLVWRRGPFVLRGSALACDELKWSLENIRAAQQLNATKSAIESRKFCFSSLFCFALQQWLNSERH